ncbi:hemolysin III family protein, partial [Klebsiella pneumoniae]|uniref:hemolysin III family protein n=1 Tax=Klebsiella pneumoniae TaxID=573 RepID=UPI001BA596F6
GNSSLAEELMIVICRLVLLWIMINRNIAPHCDMLLSMTEQPTGWLSIIVVVYQMVEKAVGGVTLLAVGGVVYSLGVIFYVCKRIPYNHAIWHGFVLGGSVCHFLAIYLYIGQS